MVVPVEGESFISFTSPPEITMDTPEEEPFVPVVMVTFETEAIEGRASPLNPMVFMLKRSSSVRVCLWHAVRNRGARPPCPSRSRYRIPS